LEPILERIDHLIYATPRLAEAVDEIEAALGVRAADGGTHQDWGTRNALIALGPRVYLEIIGPISEGGVAPAQAPFGIATLAAPRLSTWAARATSLVDLARGALHRGVDLGGAQQRTRRRPDGTVLVWTMTDPFKAREGGILPFFIDWGPTPHPATGSPGGCELLDLRAEHPEAGRVRATLDVLGLGLAVTEGARPALVATIASPRGRVELR
jgi:hypothetical protein